MCDALFIESLVGMSSGGARGVVKASHAQSVDSAVDATDVSELDLNIVHTVRSTFVIELRPPSPHGTQAQFIPSCNNDLLTLE